MATDTYLATERLWATKDGKVVKDGHKDALILLCTPGRRMSAEKAKELGLADFGKAAKKTAPVAKDKSKKAEKDK